jgi:hypothetical protein
VRRRWIQPRFPEGSGSAVSSPQGVQYGEAGDASFEAEGGDVAPVRSALRCPGERRKESVRGDRDLTGTTREVDWAYVRQA